MSVLFPLAEEAAGGLWLHHLSQLSPPQHGQAFPAMLLQLGFWEPQKAWLQGPGDRGHQALVQSRECSS